MTNFIMPEIYDLEIINRLHLGKIDFKIETPNFELKEIEFQITQPKLKKSKVIIHEPGKSKSTRDLF